MYFIAHLLRSSYLDFDRGGFQPFHFTDPINISEVYVQNEHFMHCNCEKKLRKFIYDGKCSI